MGTRISPVLLAAAAAATTAAARLASSCIASSFFFSYLLFTAHEKAVAHAPFLSPLRASTPPSTTISRVFPTPYDLLNHPRPHASRSTAQPSLHATSCDSIPPSSRHRRLYQIRDLSEPSAKPRLNEASPASTTVINPIAVRAH